MFKKNILLLSFLMVIIVLTVSACSSTESNSSNDDKINGETKINEATVEYLGEKLEKPQASLYFFWSDGCPHCASEKVFLNKMKTKYPDLEIVMYETWKNKANANALQAMAKAYGTTARGVPMTFIGNFNPWTGFSATMESDMEEKIKYCLENECIDPASKL
jgi:thiol-disulfide isomerase/thioredoxin